MGFVDTHTEGGREGEGSRLLLYRILDSERLVCISTAKLGSVNIWILDPWTYTDASDLDLVCSYCKFDGT